MDVNLLLQNWPIVLVALVTWLGVFAYLLRLDAMTRALEKQAHSVREERHSEARTLEEARALEVEEAPPLPQLPPSHLS